METSSNVTALGKLKGKDEEYLKLRNLKEILQDNYKELRLPPDFDAFLLRCLRVRKYDVARSAKLVSQYFKLFGELYDMHSVLRPSLYDDLYDNLAVALFKYRDAHGRGVILTRQERVSPAIYSFDEAFSATLLLLDDVVNCSVDIQQTGIVFICDWKGFSFAHLRQYTPSRLHMAAKLFQDAFPASFKAFHFIRNPALVGYMYAIVKPFLREKIKSRVHFHGHDFASFHKHVSVDILPEFLGGKLPNDEYADGNVTRSLLKKDKYYQEILSHSLK